jgi:hypothetical protein
VGLEDKYKKNEYEIFSILENPDSFDKVEVEYAADLPSSKYGSAFPMKEYWDDNITYKHPWNLNNVNKA